MIPSMTECELPLLEALMELGGEAEARKLYPIVRKRLTAMTELDESVCLPSGEPKWMNRIRWARLRLASGGEVDSPARGVWRITSAGAARIGGTVSAEGATTTAEPEKGSPAASRLDAGLVDIYDVYERDFRRQLLDRLIELDPYQFELFARKLLLAYGFVDVRVMAKTRDGGIDGHGRLRAGLATMQVAFQCKRWEGNVGRPEIDEFRGAISGLYQQGIFFTTADFTKGATDASIRKGVVPIVLINGQLLVDIMIRTGFGVERKPLELYFDRLDTIFKDKP